jgi:hypothetical protein
MLLSSLYYLDVYGVTKLMENNDMNLVTLCCPVSVNHECLKYCLQRTKGAMTFSIMTLSIRKLSIMPLSIAATNVLLNVAVNAL